jgi:DUF1680 family protein
VPFTRVQLNDEFWAPRIAVNRNQTLRAQYAHLIETGRIDALKLEWKPGAEPVPHIFWESDTAKWIEAASYSLASHPDDELAAMVDHVIALLEQAQGDDGYLNVYYTVVKPGKRWTNLRDNHELYCAGHLIEAGVAHAQATGSDRLLNVVRRYADYIATVFGRDAGKKRGYCGHEEIELALVKLYRQTGDSKYLNLARYFVDERGQSPYYFDIEARERGDDPASYWAKTYDYCQAQHPVRELSRVAGHAVRAMYLYSGVADIVAETGDPELLAASERLWKHLCGANMYITGGIGPSSHNEGFSTDYDLPNLTAYAETCAAIGLVFWNHRLLHIDLDGRFADIVERALYNGTISGVSLDGKKFFYENPLASDGTHHRQDWFGCACCPPNLARLLASVGEYVYSESELGLAVNLYVQGTGQAVVAGDVALGIKQTTRYPWDGSVRIELTPSHAAEFELRLRIPGWCRSHVIAVNGKRADAVVESGYAVVKRTWDEGDVIDLTLDMPVERVVANPGVKADQGRVAIARGPVVYCVESADNPSGASNIELPNDAEFSTSFEPGLLGGVAVIEAPGLASDPATWGDTLYQASQAAMRKAVTIRAVPYFAWDNREPGEMAVWLPKA